MLLIHVSDTHNRLEETNVPDGDVLLFTGDGCCNQTLEELVEFNRALGTLPHEHILVIGGNHDPEDENLAREILTNATYLCDSGVEIEGISFWGAPWQPGIGFRYNSFTLAPASRELATHWELIPDDTEFLLTHTPALGVLDSGYAGGSIGCQVLARHLQYRLYDLKGHFFGHSHGSNGIHTYESGLVAVNSAVTDDDDRATQPCHIIDFDTKARRVISVTPSSTTKESSCTTK